MNALFGTSNVWCRLRHRICQALLVFFTITAFGQTDAATRIALVGSGGNDGVGNVLDLATALLSKDTDLQLLDRAQVDRILREQAFSLAGMVRAEDAVRAGQLLHVDLFAVVEGILTNEIQSPRSSAWSCLMRKAECAMPTRRYGHPTPCLRRQRWQRPFARRL